MNDDNARWERLRKRYPEASDETLRRYLDMREEGYPQHQALIISGLVDPPEPAEEQG